MAGRRTCLAAAIGILLASGFMTQLGQSANVGTSSVVKKGVQKLTSFMFGCPALISDNPNVTIECKNKNAQGVDCGIKVPMNSVATFSCPKYQMIEEDYDNVKCIFPGMWDNEIVTCIVDVNATLLAGNSSCAGRNSTAGGNTTCLPGNTTCVPGNTTCVPGGNSTATPTNGTSAGPQAGNTTTVVNGTNTTSNKTTFMGNVTRIVANFTSSLIHSLTLHKHAHASNATAANTTATTSTVATTAAVATNITAANDTAITG